MPQECSTEEDVLCRRGITRIAASLVGCVDANMDPQHFSCHDLLALLVERPQLVQQITDVAQHWRLDKASDIAYSL